MKQTIITTIIASITVALVICGFWYAISRFTALESQVNAEGQTITQIVSFINNASKAQTK